MGGSLAEIAGLVKLVMLSLTISAAMSREIAKMKLTIIMLAAVLLLAGGAKPVWGEYTVKGTGTVPCGTFLSEEKSRRGKDMTYFDYMSWMLGYITGRNYERGLRGLPSEKRKDVSPDSTYYAAVKYCRNNPKKKLYHAMEHVYVKDLK